MNAKRKEKPREKISLHPSCPVLSPLFNSGFAYRRVRVMSCGAWWASLGAALQVHAKSTNGKPVTLFHEYHHCLSSSLYSNFTPPRPAHITIFIYKKSFKLMRVINACQAFKCQLDHFGLFEHHEFRGQLLFLTPPWVYFSRTLRNIGSIENNWLSSSSSKLNRF